MADHGQIRCLVLELVRLLQVPSMEEMQSVGRKVA